MLVWFPLRRGRKRRRRKGPKPRSGYRCQGLRDFEEEVQSPNADPENPDQKPDAGTGTKLDQTLNKKVSPGGRG